MRRRGQESIWVRWALPALALLVTLGVRPAAAQSADDDERFVVIRAKKIITVTGKEIDDGMIVLAGGKVRSVGKGLEYPRNAKVIDASDWVVMPGLINPHTRHGLPRYGRAGVQSHLAVADEYIPQDGDFDELIKSGYTMAAFVPPGAGFPGRAAVLHTAGPLDKRVVTDKSYVKILSDKATLRSAFDKAHQEIEKVDKAKKDYDEKQKQAAAQKPPQSAPASQPASTPVSQPGSQPASQPASVPTSQPAFQAPPIDPAHQALVDLLQKKDGLFAMIELSGPSDVLHANQILDKHEIARAYVLRNALQTSLYHVVHTLGEKKARVCVWPLLNRIPNSADRLLLVRDLTHAGCEVSLVPLNDSGQEHAAVLPRAAELVREGWSREDALKSVTLNPAKMLGVDGRFGAIEKDKEADFVMYDADPLDPRARVRAVMIGGEMVYRAEEHE